MSPGYKRTIDTATGRVYIDPNTGKPTEIVPSGGLSPSGLWVPLALNEDGTLATTDIVGVPHFDDAIEETTPGVEQTLIDETVPDGTTRNLSQVLVVTRVTGVFQVVSGDVVIGSGRTGPGGTGPMTWSPPRSLAAGTEYQVLFQSRENSPPQDVEAYVQATDMSTS